MILNYNKLFSLFNEREGNIYFQLTPTEKYSIIPFDEGIMQGYTILSSGYNMNAESLLAFVADSFRYTKFNVADIKEYFLEEKPLTKISVETLQQKTKYCIKKYWDKIETLDIEQSINIYVIDDTFYLLVFLIEFPNQQFKFLEVFYNI